ncbi:hypothetical protein ACFC18_31470 [Streptomyces sp. NPDC056121]|uniref:hypothetical protein n=1 Tax=unclassified Streptomyces TaxID=2593676 RepID=UPI0035D66D09
MVLRQECTETGGCTSVPTAIAVTSPDLVLAAADRHTPSAAVLHSVEDRGGRAEPYDLDRAIVEMHTLIEHHGYVIALCPASVPDLVVHRLHAVRSVLESDRIAILRPDLPPLGLAVLVLQLRQLTMCDFSPGVLASAARLLAHYIYAGAVLGSVARLDRVPVSLTSHAKSWVPGAQFAVLATPQPELVRLTGPEPPRLSGPAFGTRMYYAAGQQPTDWITGTLAPAWQVQGAVETRLPAESGRWWATGKPGNPGKLAEFAAAIPDISVLYQLVSSVRREACHWCGLELIGDRCGFCAAPLADPPAPAAKPPGGRALAPGLAAATALAPAGGRAPVTGPARAALPPAARP